MNEPHPSLLERKIIHVDMDAFYASIEIRDNPELEGKPVVIGGSPNSRAVVCTASYAARKFGIRSAMACSHAARLCPDAIFIRPQFEKYQSVSREIRTIFRRYTDLVEPLSLDEAYLDVTNNALGLFAVKIARRIQSDILQETGLTASAGVGPNKLIAKIASDIRKPHGLTAILPNQVKTFMRDLPLRKIHGIGPATEKSLLKLGLKTCQDVWQYQHDNLVDALGERMAVWLSDRAQGIDRRLVESSRIRKSMGQEETFSEDVLSVDALHRVLATLSHDIAAELRKAQLKGRTVTLKVKYADFQQVTRSLSLSTGMGDAEGDEQAIFTVVRELLAKTEAGTRKIRLLGISLSRFTDETMPLDAWRSDNNRSDRLFTF